MSKIFIKNTPVYLLNGQTDQYLFKTESKRRLCVVCDTRKDIEDTIKYVEKTSGLQEVYIIRKKVKGLGLEEDFFTLYQTIKAAGGLVFDTNGKVLLIFRNGKWDLPKGKLERKELPEAGALREVEEETGVKGLKITASITLPENGGNVTYHTYNAKGKRVLKLVYWYAMLCTDKAGAKPQTEENITALKWVKPAKLAKYYPGAYSSVVDVLKAGCGKSLA